MKLVCLRVENRSPTGAWLASREGVTRCQSARVQAVSGISFYWARKRPPPANCLPQMPMSMRFSWTNDPVSGALIMVG